MSTDVQPVTFYVPDSAAEPVEVKVLHSGLKMVLVNRESVGLLGDEWRVLGIYFLLGPAPGDPDRFRAYVGEVGRRDLLTRLVEHAAQKDWWSRALLVTSSSSEGFNSAEIGWLEGRFYDVLNNAVAAELMNKGRPGDDSIALRDRSVLERYVEPTVAALRACGSPPDTADQKPLPLGKKRAFYRESVKDLIEAGLLKVGTRLTPLRKHLTTTALVLSDGSLEVDGTEYPAVSTAAVAVSRSKSEPGWEFWGAPSGDGGFVPLFKLRERLRADQGLKVEESEHGAKAPGPTTLRDLPSARPSELPARRSPVERRRFDGSVRDLIHAGLLVVGEELHTIRQGRTERATVMEDGAIRVGDAEYHSPSGAAKAASGNTAEPGWEFWAVSRDGRLTPLYDLRAAWWRERGGSGEGSPNVSDE